MKSIDVTNMPEGVMHGRRASDRCERKKACCTWLEAGPNSTVKALASLSLFLSVTLSLYIYAEQVWNSTLGSDIQLNTFTTMCYSFETDHGRQPT